MFLLSLKTYLMLFFFNNNLSDGVYAGWCAALKLYRDILSSN